MELREGKGAGNGAQGTQPNGVNRHLEKEQEIRTHVDMVASLSICLARSSICTVSLGQFYSTRVDLLQQRIDSIPYAAKAKSQQFIRRKASLVKKVDQLARLCHSDLALIIRKNGRYYTYRSTDQDRWPPTITEIVGRDLTDT